MEEKTTVIKIDIISIVRILLVLAFIGIIYFLRDVVLLLIVAMIFAAVFSSLVDYLQRKGVPRLFGTFLTYIILFLLIIGVIWPMIPVITDEVQSLFDKVSSIAPNLAPYLDVEQFNIQSLIQKYISNQSDGEGIGTSIFSLLSSVGGNVIFIVMIFVISFYITLNKVFLKETFVSLFPKEKRDRIGSLIDIGQREIGNWGRGLLLLGLFVGVMAYIALLILGVNNALALALLAGVTEMIPYFGPYLGAIPAVLVAFGQEPIKALFVAIIYFVIQQAENHILVPQVMRRTTGLNPLAVILVVLIGGKIAGVLGIFLAVPITSVIVAIVKEYRRKRE
ncbi:MAG: AI-2E family transporter [Parcubacteria group bacterium]|nr:AI-2E family transporter [Parcubacteria group bacterium]